MPLYVATGASVHNSGTFQVSDNGTLLASAGDPCEFGVNTNASTIASTTYTNRIWLSPNTYTNYNVFCQAIGVTLTATTFCFYLTNADATGTLVTNSGSADASAVWLTAGIQSIALGTPLVVTTGAYYFVNTRIGAGTTMPKVGQIPIAIANAGCAVGTNVAPNAANVPRFGTATNAPTGITPPATSGNIITGGSTVPFWVGLT